MAKGDKKPVVMTGDIDNTVAKKLHAVQHAAGGSDPITPAAIGAVNNAGDTMKGNLVIDNGTAAGMFISNRTLSDGANTSANFFNSSDGTASVGLYSRDENKYFAELRVYKDTVEYWRNSGESKHTVFHTGNKPMGSYTGNGDATERRIDIGGIGTTIAIYSDDHGSALIARKEIIHRSANEVTGLSGSSATFGFVGKGILQLQTDNNSVNAAGVTYYYQVL